MVKQINRLKSLAEKEKQEVAAQAATPPESPEVEILKEIRDTLKAGK
jgi:large-conductance mechanosensitive channel